MSRLTLTVLGSGSCELRAERSSPAYLVTAGQTKLMLDLGQGAWRRLLEEGHRPEQVRAVLISHHHLDHLSDLLPLMFALKHDPLLREKAALRLVGHARLEPVLAGLSGVFGSWVQPPPERLALELLEPGQGLSLAGLTITTAPARHLETSLAYRLEYAGGSLVYLGDSEATAELAALARGADLLVAHCAATDQNPKPGHLHPRAAGRLAGEAGVKTLLLSHLYREVDPEQAVASAGREFEGRVLAARDGLAVEV